MDWTIFHDLNGTLRHLPFWRDQVADFSSWCVPVYIAVTLAVWFASRPGGSLRSKLACTSALASAAVALGINQLVTHLIWTRPRPFVTHPLATVLLTPHAADPGFPSDHSSAAFAIAFAVLYFHRRTGFLFLIGAALIAFSRIFDGVHYPGDVGAGVLVGLVAAAIVVTVGRRLLEPLAELVGRITDPLVRPVWRAVQPRAAR